MSELSTEEKAKRFDEALKIAKFNYDVVIQCDKECSFARDAVVNTFHHMFPELKESDDEKMLQEIKRYIKEQGEKPTGLPNGSVAVSDMLAWLEKHKYTEDDLDKAYKCTDEDAKKEFEKQCEQKPIISYDALREGIVHFGITQYQISNWLKKYVDVEKQGEQKSDIGISSTTKKKLSDSLNKALEQETAESWNEFLDEQEPDDKIQIGKKYKCIGSPRYTLFMKGDIYKPEDEFLCRLMNFCSNCFEPIEDDGQETVGYVEPIKFHVGDWCIDNEDNTTFQIVKVLDNTYTYRTKEGSEYSCPHYSLENDARLWTIQDAKDGDVLTCNDDMFSICIFSHFDGINDKFSSFSCYCGLEGEGLGQNLNIYGYHDDSTDYVPATKEQRDTLMKTMHEAGYEWDADKKELKKIEENPAWSEEDENMLNHIIGDIEFVKKNVYCQTLCEEEIEWLKLIKDRVQRKYAWKPSEEQLEALDYAYNSCPDTERGNYYEGVLESIIDDLHKLSENQELDEGTLQWIDAIIRDYEDLYKKDEDHRVTIQVKIDILKSLRDRYTCKSTV